MWVCSVTGFIWLKQRSEAGCGDHGEHLGRGRCFSFARQTFPSSSSLHFNVGERIGFRQLFPGLGISDIMCFLRDDVEIF
jgi:hypothetical protein